jgi:hypothetical protein
MNIYARITRNLGLASVVGILALDQAFAGTYENLEYGYRDVYSGPFSPPTTYFYISGYTGSPVDLIVPGVIQDDVYGEITILNSASNSTSYPGYFSSTDGIANGAFEDCTSLKSIVLPEGLDSIGGGAFKGCTNLITITLPSSLVLIGKGEYGEYGEYGVFEGCTSLKSISLPDGISYISSATFKGCTGLASITLPLGVRKVSSELFKGCTSLTSIALPESIEHIESNAFEGCTSLTQITLPDETNYIGWGAFEGCENLATINLGDDFEGVGDQYESDSEDLAEELTELPKLANINVSAENEDFTSVDGVLYNEDKSELIAFPAGRTGDFVIPAHVKTIGECAFSNSKLTSITIPDTVTFIDEYAFDGASQLQSISIPDKFATELGGMRLPSSLAFETLVKAITNKIASGTNNYGLSIKSDLNSYTTKTDAANYASKSDLNSYTTKTDAANYASKSDVSSFALKNELPQAVEKVLADIDASLGPAPVITSDLATLTLARGKAMTYSTTTNFNATAFSAVGLPTGLNINPVTGVISGKPSKKGTFSAFIYAGIPGGATTTSVKMFIVK